jgi:hypothetical protein
MKDKRNWMIFRVRGIIATAEQIHKKTKLLEAERVATWANELVDKLKEKR